MTILRMDHVGIVVDDLANAISFFTELGLALEVDMPVEGQWVDRVVGLEGVEVDIAMMRTPDGQSRIELTRFRSPASVSAGHTSPNALGIRRIMFAVQDIDDSNAASSATRSAQFGIHLPHQDFGTCCTCCDPDTSGIPQPTRVTSG